jgi:hypothetical protein
MSSRHSSHGGSPRGSHTPSSASYHSYQPSQQQQYLRPEDVYRMDRDSSYFSAADHSYAQSRHGSITNSPRHSAITPPDQRQLSHSHSPSPFDQYPYQPAGLDSPLSSSRRITPPDEICAGTRHTVTQSGSRHENPKDTGSDRGQGSSGGSPKGKGKEREREEPGEGRRRSGNGRHDSAAGSGNRKGSAGPANKLVSGVFIRY